MAPDWFTQTASGVHPLHRLGTRLSPGAALALVATSAVLWFVATGPTDALDIWALGPEARLSRDQVTVFLASMLGVMVLAAACFALAVYAAYWPAVQNRLSRQELVVVRAKLQALQLEKDELLRKMASLRQLRAEIALYEAELLRAREGSARAAGRAAGNGREIVDHILSELEAEVPVGAD
jgi:hypothetical protein